MRNLRAAGRRSQAVILGAGTAVHENGAYKGALLDGWRHARSASGGPKRLQSDFGRFEQGPQHPRSHEHHWDRWQPNYELRDDIRHRQYLYEDRRQMDFRQYDEGHGAAEG